MEWDWFRVKWRFNLDGGGEWMLIGDARGRPRCAQPRPIECVPVDGILHYSARRGHSGHLKRGDNVPRRYACMHATHPELEHGYPVNDRSIGDRDGKAPL